MLYKINLSFTDRACKRIHDTKTRIVIAKPDSSGVVNVAWVVFDPFSYNSIQWREEYGMYVSNIEVQNGAELQQFAKTPIPSLEGHSYDFEPAGVFSTANPHGGLPNAFAAVNNYDNLTEKSGKGYLTMGLTQDVNVNGDDFTGNVISAAPVLYRSTAVMTPSTTIYIGIQSNIKSNTVITEIHSQMTQVKFGDGIFHVDLAYDDTSGKFAVQSSS